MDRGSTRLWSHCGGGGTGSNIVGNFVGTDCGGCGKGSSYFLGMRGGLLEVN